MQLHIYPPFWILVNIPNIYNNKIVQGYNWKRKFSFTFRGVDCPFYLSKWLRLKAHSRKNLYPNIFIHNKWRHWTNGFELGTSSEPDHVKKHRNSHVIKKAPHYKSISTHPFPSWSHLDSGVSICHMRTTLSHPFMYLSFSFES